MNNYYIELLFGFVAIVEGCCLEPNSFYLELQSCYLERM